MTYFPNEVFTNILSYCDDTIEEKIKKQKNKFKEVLKDLSTIVEDSYRWSNQENEEDIYLFEENTSVKFCYTWMADTYNEIGMDWLAVRFHPNDNKVLDFYDYYKWSFNRYTEDTFNY